MQVCPSDKHARTTLVSSLNPESSGRVSTLHPVINDESRTIFEISAFQRRRKRKKKKERGSDEQGKDRQAEEQQPKSLVASSDTRHCR